MFGIKNYTLLENIIRHYEPFIRDVVGFTESLCHCKKKKEAMTKLNSEVSPGISKHFIIFRQLAAIMQMHVVHQLHWC